ncbi:RICIN domain-containing protein [Streptomyces pinistramenti]|uniref:RICIN domain-containing protein n=1 Tax=Streptomyces pinistramenti TaxID=2884812 RepID=UPI001D0690A3|nr:RICIN domain-containing protein [Streptomyces pinistramenti]MCB5909130.1 RICIN domain-containing protein [Streptomyces pinistramenti]
MSLWTSLEPASTTVDPGGSTTVRLRLRNTGDVVDEYRCVPVGDLAPWTTVEPQSIRLYPGTTGSVELTFAPPRTPDATAGPNPYGVQIIPTEHPEATTVPEGNVTITPFSEVRAELVPQTVKGRFRGRPKLAIDNFGNVALTASVNGSDNGDQISYDIYPANVQIQPGRAAFIKATLKPRQIIWAGAKQSRPFTLGVQRSGAEPLPVRGTYVQPGLLPRWLGVVLSMLLALAIAFLMIWFTYKPSVATKATEKPQQEAVKTVPTPDPKPTPSAPKPESDPKPEHTKGGGDGAAAAKAKAEREKYHNVLLRNGTTRKCANVSDKGSIGGPVDQLTCNGGDGQEHQLWSLELMPQGKGAGPGNADLYQIKNVKDGYCMDLPDNGPAPKETHITEGPCTGRSDDNQSWWLEKRVETNLFWIHNYTSDNLCMDVSGYASSGGDMADKMPLTLFGCSDTDDQGWSIDKP